MSSPKVIDRAMMVDEIGIVTARHEDFVLRSAFQLVYRPDGTTLRAVAAEGFLRPRRGGATVAPETFLCGLDAEARTFVERLAMPLHLGNHRHVGIDGLDHVLVVRSSVVATAGGVTEFVRWLAFLLDDAELPASALVCLVRGSAPDAAAFPALADELRSLGVKIAIGGLDGEQPPLERIRHVTADIVRIDGGWFRRVCRNDGALRLLGRLVRGFKGEGAQVLIEGIETRHQLAAALDAGADLLQGCLLSRPEPAGVVLDAETLPLEDLLPGGANVVSLFAERRG